MAQRAKAGKICMGQCVVRVKPRRRPAAVTGREAEPARLGKDHPLASVAGSFADDPFWDEFVQAMRAAREADARHLAEEFPDVRP